MFRKPIMAAFVVAALITLLADDSSAAIAKRLGKSGLSGRLSSNRAIRRQQLIADPARDGVAVQGQAEFSEAPKRGSTSVRYDPTLVTLADFDLGPGYFGEAFVEISDGDGGTRFESFGAFLDSPGAVETGYVQVSFDINPPDNGEDTGTVGAGGTPGQISIAQGYTQVDQDGPFGTDTHAFLFDVLEEVSDTQDIEYTIFANSGGRPSGNAADFLVGEDAQGEYRVDPDQITSATVRGSLTAIPLPAAVWMGGAMLAGLVASGKVRRRLAQVWSR